MRKTAIFLCLVCLLALPVSAEQEVDWREMYCQVALEAFRAWDDTTHSFIFQLLDLNKDGVPEFFVGLDYYAYADTDDVTVYTVLNGRLCKFDTGPQDRPSAARYFTQYSDPDCSGGYVYKVTYYDFETCTRQAAYFGAEKDMRGQIAEYTARYGLRAAIRMFCTMNTGSA